MSNFLVTIQQYYTRDVTYEVEGTCESDAHGNALKGGNMVFSMEEIQPSSMVKVMKIIPRTKFACANCFDSYANATALRGHTEANNHSPALDK